jgi:hypothetical protein
MVRIVKLYKMTKGDDASDIDDQIAAEPSKVGKKLTELTTRRVIVGILLMLVVLPAFDGGYDDTFNQFQIDGLGLLHRFSQQQFNSTGIVSPALMENGIHEYVRDGGKLFWLDIHGVDSAQLLGWVNTVTFFNEEGTAMASPPDVNPADQWSPSMMWKSLQDMSVYRSAEADLVQAEGCFDSYGRIIQGQTCTSFAYFDNRGTTSFNAVMNILKTFFVMMVCGSLL